MGKKETSNDDILKALGELSDIMFDRFDKIDGRFEQIDTRFEQIDSRFEQIDKRFAQIDKRIDGIYNILDAHMKRIEEILQESAMRDRQQARMEAWIFQLADKLDVKLNYDR